MHDGSLATLSDVIDFYDRGGIDNPGKDPLLRPLHLSAVEKQQLAAFLLTLTSDQAGRLAASARATFTLASANEAFLRGGYAIMPREVAGPSMFLRIVNYTSLLDA